MKKLVAVVVVVALAAALYVWAWPALQKNFADLSVRDRVEGWLEAQRQGDEQTALSMWAKGEAVLPMAELSAYTNRYDAFRRRHEIGDRIESFVIEKVEGPRAHVVIDGRRLELVVRANEPIRAAE